MALNWTPLVEVEGGINGEILDSGQKMQEVLDYVFLGGYTGTVSLTAGSNGAPVYSMWLNHETYGTTQRANLGDYIVIENNSIARVVQADQFPSRYSVA